MVSKITKTLAAFILALLPYSTVLSSFSPYFTTHSFQNFLLASLVFGLISLLLGLFVSQKKNTQKAVWLLFLLGMFTAPPFMLGTPEVSAKILEKTAEEHFRYGMLLLATVLFFVGFMMLLRKHVRGLSYKLILLLLLICTGLLFWDNLSSFNFSAELKNWIAAGHKADDFFPQYNFHETLRTLGRSLVYVLVTWLSFILLRQGAIKKGQAIFLAVFSGIGIIFFFLTNFIGMQFYFPFMVPAVALAPAYWLAIMLLASKHNVKTEGV